MIAFSLLHILLALALAPLLSGLVNRVKAKFAGRRGQPVLQLYFDLFKLLHKGEVYSRTTSWVFRAGPVIGLACALLAVLIVPMGRVRGAIAFNGDILVLLYGLALMRFMTVLAAMDTGSPFEGMGASREVQFSMLAEPAMLLGLAALSIQRGSACLSTIYQAAGAADPALLLVAGAMLIVFLTENARIPVDDPNTHLELTMIHEVMVLDHGGVDLAIIEYAAALKFWVLGALLVGLAGPLMTGLAILDLPLSLVGMAALAGVVGLIESTMARLRLLRVPQLLVAASALAVLAVVLALR